jgi:hypothetical protein
MNYGEILSKAWKTIWKHKILWLFGVLAGCAASGTSGGGGASGASSSSITTQPGSLDFLAPSTQAWLNDLGQFIVDVPVWVWILLVIGLVAVGFFLSVAFLMVGSLGQAGVIAGTSLADQADPEDKTLSFGTIFKALKPHYWKVFLFNIGFRLVGFIITILMIFPIIVLAFCTCCLGLLLLIPVGWLIDTLVNFVVIAIIEEEIGVFEAISRAWQVITRNLVSVLVMFLILGLGGLIVGLIISLPLLIIPVLANVIITGGQAVTVGLVISLLLSLVFIPLLVFLGGVLKAFILASWTLTYRRLAMAGELTPTVLSDKTDEE